MQLKLQFPRTIVFAIASLATILVSLAITIIVATMVAWHLVGKDPMKEYLAIHAAAKTQLPIAVEFEELFPANTDHFITHFGFDRWSDKQSTVWTSDTYFLDRYQLTMQIPIEVDYEQRTFTTTGDPDFYLVECTDFDGRSSSHDGLHFRFGKKEWQDLYASHGDFLKLGLSLKKDSPITGFDELIRSTRSPRIHISLLGGNRSSNHTD